MKNKKNIFILIAIIVIISAIVTILLLKNKQKDSEKEVIITAETTEQQRMLWNDFLVYNPYLSQIDEVQFFWNETDIIKLAITCDGVETQRIVTEEIQANNTLTLGDGYKKSKNNINEYAKKIIGKEEIAYNFVDTYVEENNYLMIGEEYVYFTKINIPEKIYIAVKYKEENSNYEVEIYEYNVTQENKQTLMEMLKSGQINEQIQTANKYILTGQIENGNIRIATKIKI